MVVLVPLSLLIKRDGHPDEFHPLKCPARKPLVEVVRPMLTRMLSPQSASHAEAVLVKLDIRKASRHVEWTSQAREFVVSFFYLGRPTRSFLICPLFLTLRFLPRCMECSRGIAMGMLSVCLSVRPSVCPSVRLSVCQTRAL